MSSTASRWGKASNAGEIEAVGSARRLPEVDGDTVRFAAGAPMFPGECEDEDARVADNDFDDEE